MHTPFSLRSTLARLGVLLFSLWACRLGSAPPTPLPGSTAPPQNTPLAVETRLSAEVPAFAPGRVVTDVPYCQQEGEVLRADVYFPVADSPAPHPAVVHLHGGGWRQGSKEVANLLPQVKALQAQGVLVLSVNYRLAPAYRFPAMIEDAKCAVRYLRANAPAYRLDPQHIGAMGGSAGGHLAALLGLTDESAGWDVGPYLTQSSQVQAVVDFFGPTDLTTLPNTPEFQALLQEVFGTADRTSPILRQASPLTYVHPGAPPFLIVQGLADTVVPPDQSQRLAMALQEAGVPVETLWVQHGGHGLWPQGGPLQPPLSEITQHAVDFLVQNLGENAP